MLTNGPLEQCGRPDCDEQTHFHCECGIPVCWKHMFRSRGNDKMRCLECYLETISNGTYEKANHWSGNREC